MTEMIVQLTPKPTDIEIMSNMLLQFLHIILTDSIISILTSWVKILLLDLGGSLTNATQHKKAAV